MKVNKKFNEKIQDIIFYSGGKKEASELLGISEELIDDFLEMEEAPNEAIGKGVDATLEESIDESLQSSREGQRELDEFTPASGMLDRAITFFNGKQIEDQILDFREEIDPDKSYEIGLQIFKEGDVSEWSFQIQGEYLKDLADWESIAWEVFRDIADAYGSEVSINVNSIG